jgi:hypothetical protein
MNQLVDWLHITRPTSYDVNEIRLPDDDFSHRELVREIESTCYYIVHWAESVGLDDLSFEARRAEEALKRVA